MIATTTGNSPLTADYLNKNQANTAPICQENGRKVPRENGPLSTDQVCLTYSSATVTTYNSSLSLEKQMGDGYDLLRGLVLNIFKDQGLDYTIATENAEIDISTLTPEKAQESIADDGYFGVEKTSDRIVQFAIGMAGGDPARIDAIRRGIDDGFQQALDVMGGWLPDISYDTYDSVMQKLDDWADIDMTNSIPEPPTQVKS